MTQRLFVRQNGARARRRRGIAARDVDAGNPGLLIARISQDETVRDRSPIDHHAKAVYGRVVHDPGRPAADREQHIPGNAASRP